MLFVKLFLTAIDFLHRLYYNNLYSDNMVRERLAAYTKTIFKGIIYEKCYCWTVRRTYGSY